MLLWGESFSVFPTHVGVIPRKSILAELNLSIPHACGGDPLDEATPHLHYEYSPRMWG